MNKETAKDYLPLVKALSEGKLIQIVDCVNGGWLDYKADKILFDGPASDYRIKPEPREFWMNRVDGYDSQRIFHTKESARNHAVPEAVQVLFREVIE